MPEESVKISKFLSYVLRHAPWEYELELDDEGWVAIQDVLNAMAREHDSWRKLTKHDLVKFISASDKQRQEIRGSMIRALYGHSLPKRLKKTIGSPPEWLYHGTSPSVRTDIDCQGLQPKSRQYVHLSSDIETAITVGKRKCQSPVILRIAAKRAEDHGVKFYVGNEKVWLADSVPPQFIDELL